LAHSLPNRGVTDEMTNHISFSVIIRDLHFVFMTATAENPVSRKLSQKEAKPLLLCLINLDSCFSQAAKTEEVYLYQSRVSRNRHSVWL
jgi:hypothetical protein